MNFQPASVASLTIFCIFAGTMAAAISWSFLKAKVPIKFLLAFYGLTLTSSLLAASGVFQRWFLPMVPLFFLSLIAMSAIFARNAPGKLLSEHFNFRTLVGFQVFRLPLEFILHHWAETGVIPQTMTWTGQNLDVITGLSALFLAPFADQSRKIGWLFQITGFGLLLNVFRVVIMSSPFPFSWKLEQPLLLAAYFPYVLIGPLFVWPALFGHVLLFKKLFQFRARKGPTS